MSPNSFEQRLLATLQQRKAQIEHEVFAAPPLDWPSFQHRFGQWEENRRLLDDVSRMVAGFEEEEGRPT